MKPFRAIAAMSLNRVIGCKNDIPWRIPEDFKWFRECTIGQVVVMGRKTFESLRRKPLPKRENWILSHSSFPLFYSNDEDIISTVKDLAQLEERAEGKKNKQIWICGGSEIYEQLLPRCKDLYLTIVKTEVSGDRLFPAFESYFSEKAVLKNTETHKVIWYVNSNPKPLSTNAISKRLIDLNIDEKIDLLNEENLEEMMVEQLIFNHFNFDVNDEAMPHSSA
jgi:dihydrofolate reductase